MQFPKWAPQILVTTLDSSIPQVRHDSNWESHMRGMLEQDPRKADILRALLTRPDMEKAWNSLHRPPSVRFHDKYREKGSEWFYTEQVPIQLWLTVLRAIGSVEAAISDGRTGAQRRHDLLQLAQAAQRLSEAISHERGLWRDDSHAVLFGLERQNERSLSYPIEPDTARDDSDARFGPRHRLAWQVVVDIRHARESELERRKAYTALNPRPEKIRQMMERRFPGRPLSPRQIPRDAQIPEDRVLEWADRASRLKLTYILEAFADVLRERAARRPEVSQPNRGAQALRPVLIRGLFRFMYEHFDQPLDETVAIIASTVLGGELTMDRDDVKQYRRRVKIIRPASR